MRALIPAPLYLAALFLVTLLSACSDDDDKTLPSPSLSVADVNAIPAQTSVDVTVLLSAASTSTVTVDYATVDGTAVAGTDYTAASGTLTFPAGILSQVITISLLPDRDTTTTKTFHLQLTNATQATIADSTAIITLFTAADAAIFNSAPYLASWGNLGVFSSASQCASCHTGTSTVMNFQGQDVSPYTNWRHDVMAHALNDPYYQAVVEEETHVFPHLKGFIEDTCLRCHAPMGHTQFHQTTADPESFYSFEQAMSANIAREGISCTACHQMKDVNLGTVASMSGHYTINTEADRDGNGDLPLYGPYAAPIGLAMQNQTQYAPTYPVTAHMGESKLCASCHNLYTPTLDLAGQLVEVDALGTVAQFPEQTPFFEWENSRYAVKGTADYQSCQNCHMSVPEAGYQTPITTTPQNAPARSPFAVHHMAGGNVQLLELLKTYRVSLGIADSTSVAGFDAKILETRKMLSRAANLAIGTTSLTTDTLTLPVTITNLTGHKLPTSFPSRRMWLHLAVKDSTGAVIFESGKANDAGWLTQDTAFTSTDCLAIDKPAGFDTSLCYEPHRNLITNASQTAIYEAVLGDVNANITHVLLHARNYLKDNRIPPTGYKQSGLPVNPAEPGKLDADIIGVDPADTDFASGFTTDTGADGKDTVTYQIDVSGRSAPFTVTAELLYQSIRPTFVKGLHADDAIVGDSFIRRFKAMNNNVPPVPVMLTSATATVNAD